jgi:hypothetical protein
MVLSSTEGVQGVNVNYKDLCFKVMWTCLQAGLSYLLVASADWQGIYVLPVVAVLTAATGYVRQQLGTTPPDAAAVQAMDETTPISDRLVGRRVDWRDARPWDV